MKLELNKIYSMDALAGLSMLPDESVNCIVTSPPYYGLRDYGMDGQIGLEETPEAFISALVEIFREAKRVLRNDGTIWINIGDSYAGGGRAGNNPDNYGKHKMFGKTGWDKSVFGKTQKVPNGLKPKDIIGIPWMLAFALRNDGWYLRQDIIWSKPNPMPESVRDRCTKSHEYIFLLSKSNKYFFDNVSIQTEVKKSSEKRLAQDIVNQKGSDIVPFKTNGTMKAVVGGRKRMITEIDESNPMYRKNTNREYIPQLVANKRSVWEVATKPFSEAHFATFPQELIVDCIKAGCPEGGTVLDPFMGAGTTALVARKLNRNFIGFELNPDYIQIANRRIQKELGLFI